MRKRKWFTKAAASTLTVCMVGTTVLSGNIPMNALAADPVKDEWQQIQDVVRRYYGEWKDTSYSGAVGENPSNTALLGNGDVGIVSGGNDLEKTFYVSKGDFWEYSGNILSIGGVTIRQSEDDDVVETETVNLAPFSKNVTASVDFDSFPAKNAVSGKIPESAPSIYGWVTDIGKTHWLQLEFEEPIDIARYVVKSDAFLRPEQVALTTSDFELQISDTGEEGSWVVADKVVNNAKADFDKNLDEPVKARFVRLYITKPTQETTDDSKNNPRARIVQFELYAEPKAGAEEPVEPGEFYEKQDILNAEIQTEQQLAGVPTEMKTWLASDDNILVTELTSKGDKDAEFEVNTWASEEHRDIRPVTAENDEDSVTITRETQNLYTDNERSYTSKVALSTKVIGADDVAVSSNQEEVSGDLKFTLKAGETVYIVSVVGGGGRTYTNTGDLWEGAKDPVDDASAVLADVKNVDEINQLNAERQDWWKDFWSASYIDFGTEDAELNKLQKYYYGAQYILGSTARKDKIAPGIYGVWNTTDDKRWSSGYTMNYNFISTFYGANFSNRTEIAQVPCQGVLAHVPFAEEYASNTEVLKAVNKEFVEKKVAKGDIDPINGIEDAVLFGLGVDAWGYPTGEETRGPVFLNEVMCAGYNASALTQYYEYTLDEKYLKQTYELLKKCANFYEKWLEYEDGRYNLYAGWCEGTWAKNPAVELVAAQHVFKNLLSMSEILGVDEDKRALWEEIYEDISIKPTWEIDGKTLYGLAEERLDSTGGALDYFWHGTLYTNIVMLDYFLPGDSLGYFSTPEELEIARNTIDYLDMGANYSLGTAWEQQNNFPRVYPDAVRMRYDIDTVVTNMVDIINSQMRPNLRIDDGTHGTEKSGATEAINSMMLTTDKGITKVFPNWYADKDAKFADLRAKGAFTVSAEYDGTVQEAKNVTVTSEKGSTMTLVSPWEEGARVVDSEGNEVKTTIGLVPNWEVTENATITFDTVAGETYHIEKALCSDKSVLEQVVKYAKTFEQENCTEAQWETFQAEIEKAQVVLDKEDATQEEISNAVLTLKAAIVDFEKKVADRVVLKEIIDTAKTSFNQEDYTAKQWNEFQREIEKAQSILDKDDVTPEEVPDTIAALEKAMENLVKVYPYIKVNDISAGSTFPGAMIKPENMINDSGMSSVTELEATHDNEGNSDTAWVTTANPGENAWTQMDLGNVYSLDEMWIWNMNQAANIDCTKRGFKNVKIEYSTDGENWTALAVPEGMAFEDGDEDYPFQFAKASGAAQIKATNLNDGNNTPVSFGGAEARYVKITANPEAGNGSWGDVYYGMSELRFTVLEKAEKDDLTALIGYAQDQQNNENYQYVVKAVKEAFEKALAEAVAVKEKVDATQEEVDAAYDKLLDMVGYLDFTGNSTELKVTIDAAKELNPDRYTEESWAVLEEELAKAEAVLSDENALQAEIDAANEALNAAMKGLVIAPVDRSALEKLVKKAQKYEDKIDQYTEQTAGIFTDALAEARKVLDDENATQKDIDRAYGTLQNAIFNLRLIPNKDKLDELIKAAEKVDTSKYTDASVATFKAALENAKAVFADDEATEEEVKAAEKELKKAQKNLVAKADVDDSKDNNGNNGNKDNKPAKTGDAASVWTMLLVCAAAVVTAGTVVIRRKRH